MHKKIKQTLNMNCSKLFLGEGKDENIFYYKVEKVDARCSVTESLSGYWTCFYNSDFRCATI